MAGKQYARNMDGLIDACFDQLQDLRDGISNAIETAAFAKTAEIIVRGVEADLRRKELQYGHEERMFSLETQKLELIHGKGGDNERGEGEEEGRELIVGSATRIESSAMGGREGREETSSELHLESCTFDVD